MTNGSGRRTRLVVIAIVVGCLLVAAILDRGDASGSNTGATPVALGPRLPAAGAEATAWYCAEGTSNPGGRADERVFVANVGRHVARARITVFPGADQAAAVRTVEVPPGGLSGIHVADIAATAEPGVLVETAGSPAVVTHSITGNGDAGLGPCARDASPEWHFAAGTTARGASLWLALFNPFRDDAIVDIGFLTNSGALAPGELQGFVVPGQSRVTVAVHDQAHRDDLVATQVTSRRGRVVAEQSQVLDGTDGRKGLSLSLGAPALGHAFEFPNGSVGPGRSETLVVANPAQTPATATVRTRLDAGALEPEIITVPAQGAVAVDLGRRVPPGVGFSVGVSSRAAIVAETLTAQTAPVPSNQRGIATNVGEHHASRRWVLAPSRVGNTSDLVAILNLGRAPVSFRTRFFSGGRVTVPPGATGRIEPGRRAVVNVAALGLTGAGVLEVDASGPVLVAREAAGMPGITIAHAVPDLGR
jgi:uncharacterized protein DUF5719